MNKNKTQLKPMDIKGKCKAKDFKTSLPNIEGFEMSRTDLKEMAKNSRDLQNYLLFKTIGIDYIGGYWNENNN